MDKLLNVENLRIYGNGGWEVPFSFAGYPGDMIFIQGTQRKCNHLFELLCGLKRPDEGRVMACGTDLYSLEENDRAAFRCRHIGAIPYGCGLIPEVKLIDQIILPMRKSGMCEAEIQSRIREKTFTYLPIHAMFNAAASSTERTKALCGIMQATVMDQEIIIFHSPFDSLTELDTDLVWRQFLYMREKASLFVYISSDPAPCQAAWTHRLQI